MRRKARFALIIVLGVALRFMLTPASADTTPRIAAEIPRWRAVLYGKPPRDPDFPDYVTAIRIRHANRVLVDDRLSVVGSPTSVIRFFRAAPAGHTIVWADLTSLGRDAALRSVLYDFSNIAQRPKMIEHSWSGPGYSEQIIAGETVFITSLAPFAAGFEAREFAVMPIQVMALRGGSFADVSRKYPRLLENEADAYRAQMDRYPECPRQEQLGAYLADMIRLNRVDAGLRYVTLHLRSEDEQRFFDLETSMLRAAGALPIGMQLGPIPGGSRCT